MAKMKSSNGVASFKECEMPTPQTRGKNARLFANCKNGKGYTASRGEHYTNAKSFAQAVHGYAKSKGIKATVSIKDKGETVEFGFYEPEEAHA